MTDFYAFVEWLWGCNPRLAVRTQDYHDSWRKLLAYHNERQPEAAGGQCIIDGRYLVTSEKHGLALYSLMERNEGPLAVYHSPGPLFADLIAHSIRRSGHLSAEAFSAESVRLLKDCQRAWAEFGGGKR